MRRKKFLGTVMFALAGLGLLGGAAALARVGRTSAAAPSPTHIEVASRIAVVPAADPHELRVCADPNNMPFSNDRGEGFENRIAALAGRELGRRVSYYWMPQRRGFIRNTLRAGFCDVVIGLPARFTLARMTSPYYTSSYVFVSRHDRRLQLRSLDDPVLRRLRIGVQITGDDYSNPPAAQALAARALTPNLRGYTVYGDYSRRDPQREVVDAVARGDVDAAIVWGPLAGYFARREQVAIDVAPVSPAVDRFSGRFTFAIAMGVRTDDRVLHDALERVLVERRHAIQRVLREYGVPLVSGGESTSGTVPQT